MALSCDDGTASATKAHRVRSRSGRHLLAAFVLVHQLYSRAVLLRLQVGRAARGASGADPAGAGGQPRVRG